MSHGKNDAFTEGFMNIMYRDYGLDASTKKMII